MLLTTRAAKLVKCVQLHTTSKVPREKRVSQPWFIQSEDVYTRMVGLIQNKGLTSTFYNEIPTHTLCTYEDLILYAINRIRIEHIEGLHSYMLTKACLHYSAVIV